jgi:hypothetical protein
MSFKEFLARVKKSEEYKKFVKEYSDAQICGGMFILDFMSNDTKNSIDYKVGERLFTFNIKDNGKIYLDEQKFDFEVDMSKFPKPEKIDDNLKIEIEDLKGIVGVKKLEEGIRSGFSKIIAVLQGKENKTIWNLTCILDELIILSVVIDAITGEILKFERRSMMDLIKRK